MAVIEKGDSSYGAYVPDSPGVGVVGRTMADVKRLIAEAVALHLEGLREDGLRLACGSGVVGRHPNGHVAGNTTWQMGVVPKA